MSISERLAELFRKLNGEKVPPVVRRVEAPVVQPAKPTQAVENKPTGHVAMRNAAVSEAAPRPHAAEVAPLRKEIQHQVAIQAKDQPVGKKLEVLLEAAGSDVSPQIKQEVQQLAHALSEAPSRAQWEQIQESLGRLSQYSDMKSGEAAQIVRSEVQQYTFSQVLEHAQDYGLKTSDAPQVARTFKDATVARHRELQAENHHFVAHSEVQHAIENEFIEAEAARNMRSAQETSNLADEVTRDEDKKKQEKQQANREELEADEARRGALKDSEDVARYVNETLIHISDPAMKEFLLKNPIQSQKVIEFLGEQFKQGKNIMEASRALSERFMSPNQPFSAQDASEIRRLLTQVELATGEKGLMRIEGGSVPYASPGPEWWAEGPNNKGVLYGAGRTVSNHGAVGVPEVDAFLTNAQARINADPEGAQSLTLMSQLDQEFRELLRNLAGRPGATAFPNEVFAYQKDISQNVRDLIEKSRDHVNLGLTGDYKEAIWRKGPTEALSEKLREVEEFTKSFEGDTPRAQAAMRTLEQMLSYVTDPRFSTEWRRDLLANGVSFADANVRIEGFMNKGLDVLSNNVDWRRNLVKLFNAYTAQGMTEEKFAQLLSPFGSEGYLGTLALFDGKVSAAYDYFDAAVLSAHREDHSDDLIWLSPDKLKDVYKKATAEMKQGKMALLVDKNGNKLPDHQIDEIAFLAQEAHYISGRTVLAMNKGLAPMEQPFYDAGTRFDKQHPFSGGGGSNLERAASARKPLRFGFLRWDLANEGVRMNLDSSATFAARGNRVDVVVKRLIQEAQSKNKVEDLVRYTCDLSAVDARNPGIVKKRLADTYLGYDPEGRKRAAPTTLAEAAANLPLLEERLMSKIGLQIVENSVMDYTMLDSGPMGYSVLNKLAEKFSYADQLGISIQVRQAYAGVLGGKSDHERHHAMGGLVDTLKKAARYNPTDLLSGHVDMHSFATEDWFNTLNRGEIASFLSADLVSAGGVQSAGDLVKVVTRVDANIESLIKEEVRKNNHHGRIDWSAPTLSAAHTDIVRKSLQAATGKPAGTDAEIGLANFIKIKQSIATHVGLPAQINRATEIDFMTKYGYQTNSSMDCWLDLAENPDVGDRAVGTAKKLSEELGRRGSGDLLVRMHGDTETALKAKEIVFQAIQTIDWKTYVKAVAEIRGMTRNVYGQPWDGRAVMYYTAGLLEGRSQDYLSEVTFDMSQLIRPKDSKLRRILNSDHGPSDAIEDRHEMVGEIENIFVQSLEAVDEELAGYFLEYVKLNFGPNFYIIENNMLWAKRAYRVVAVGAVLLAVGLLKEGTDELGVGGGGGGGGGGHH